MNPGLHYPVTNTDKSTSAFVTLKALVSTPALCLCDPDKPFTVYYMKIVASWHHVKLKNGHMQQPVAYYSAKLDTVACG